jgi:general secretion pathway protein L
MLKEFLSWWTQQMLDLVPKRLSALGEDRANALIVAPHTAPGSLPAEVELSYRKARQERTLGHFTLDAAGIQAVRRLLTGRARPARVVLRLPTAALLERTIVLPLAAERELERVLRYEMDRLTPFSADAAFWSSTIERRDSRRGRLYLRVSVIPKAGLAPLIGALEQAGAAPHWLETPMPQGEPRLIAVAQSRSRSDLWRRRSLAAAGGLCGILAIAVVALPFVQQSIARQSIENRIEALRSRVAQAEALRQRLARDKAAADVLAAEKARVGDVLQAMARVTDVLPDDTYLTQLTLHGRRLTLSGQSLTAAKLIAVLSADPLLSSPAFAAPVTRVDGGTAELFSIGAELRQ